MEFSAPDGLTPDLPLASKGDPTLPICTPVCEGDALHMSPMINLEIAGLRRSSRLRSRSAKAKEADQTKEVYSLSQYGFFNLFGGSRLIAALAVNHEGYKSLQTSPNISFLSRSVERFHHLNAHYNGTFNVLSNFAYAAINDSNNTYSLKEMLKQDDVAHFVEAMIKVLNNHETRRHWICVPRSAKPEGTKTILAIWSFK